MQETEIQKQNDELDFKTKVNIIDEEYNPEKLDYDLLREKIKEMDLKIYKTQK